MSPPNAPSVSAPPCAPPAPPDQRWFKDEVHAHDSSVKAYLRGLFHSLHDIDDVVQEAYLRIWKVRGDQPIKSAKSFLFSIARHLAIDALRRRQTAKTESLGDMTSLAVIEDRRDAADQLCYQEKVELLAAAFVNLPPRCREIMTLRKLKGMPNKEIAQHMGISLVTVENQITRGIHLCRDFLETKGVKGFNRE